MAIRYLSGINVDSNTLFVDSANDRIGVGTGSPAYKLDVSGSGRFSGDINLGSSGEHYLQNDASTTFLGLNFDSPYIRFGVNNTERLRITAAGNVGIGTTSPLVKLHVDGTGTQYIRVSSSDNATFQQIGAQSGGTFVEYKTLYRFVDTDAGERMRITAAGNVGIGTTAPSSILHVDGIDPYVRINNVNSANNQGIKISYNYADTHGFHLTYNANAAGAYIDNTYQITAGQAWGDIYFRQNSAGTMVTRMTIKADGGNVGIGTTSPAQKLHVVGNTTITGVTYTDIVQTYSGASIDFRHQDASVVMRVDTANARVGIGTTSPSYKLDVSGDIRSTTINLGTQGVNVSSYGFLSQTLSGQMTFLGHNVRASSTVNNTALVVNGGWISSLIKQYYNEGITFHTSTTEYAAGATYPLADTERMRITSAGNVGIGTTSTFGRLQISGTVVNPDLSSATATGVSLVISNSDTGYGTMFATYGNGNGALQQRRTNTNTYYDFLLQPHGGNVGIGTSSPVVKLQVDGTITSTGVLTAYTSVPSINIGHNGDSAFIAATSGSGANTPISFSVGNNNEKMRITADGNVGIGTTSPSGKLTLYTDGDQTLRFTHPVSGTFPRTDRIVFGSPEVDGGSSAIYGVQTAASGAPGYLSFYTTSGGSSFERMRIASTGATRLNAYGSGSFTGTVAYNLAVDSSGNIIETAGGVVDGSGTANYVSKWSDANTLTDSIIYDNGTNVGIGTTSPAFKLQVNHGTTSEYVTSFRNTADNLQLKIGTTTGALLNIQGATINTNVAYNIALQADGGNVGIGTTSPSQKLTVSGSTGDILGITNGTTTGYGYVDNNGFGLFTSSGAGGTGIYYRTANIIDHYVNGSIAMRLNSTGNVGIGTTSPTSPLHISSATNKTITLDYTAGSGSYSWASFRQSGTEQFRIWGSYSDGYLSFYNDQVSAHQFTLASSGNVGVGTTSPNSKLNVVGDAATNGLTVKSAGNSSTFPLRVTWSSGSDGDMLNVDDDGRTRLNNAPIPTVGGFTNTTLVVKQKANGLYGGGLHIEQASTDNVAYFGFTGSVFNIGTSYRTSGSFQPIAFVTNGSERLRIANDGNVGIGTTSPNRNLTVSGNGTLLGIQSDTAGGYSEIEMTANGVGGGYIFKNSAAFTSYAGAGSLNIYNSGSIGFHTASVTNAMFIASATGNVGIGTTSPANKLVVANAGQVFIDVANTSSTADAGIRAHNTTVDSYMGVNVTGAYIYTATNHPVLFYTNTTERLRITADGNVGIGTTSPSGKLSISTPNAYDGTILQLQSRDEPTAYNLKINEVVTSGVVRWSFDMTNSSAYNNVLVFDRGKVGIGTTDPTQIFHVSGNIRVTGAYYDSNNSAGSSGQVLSSTGSGTDWVSLSEITGVDGTGTANYIAKWSDTDTITNSQVFDNGTNVGINNASPKTKLDVNGAIGFGSKSMSMTDTFAAALTINMNDHNGCYVKLTAFGDWANHSTIAYLGEFFIQASEGSYNEPGIIIRQVDNTGGGDDIQAQIVDPAGTGTRDFVIQLKATSASNTPFTAHLQYEVRGLYNSVS